MGFISPTPPPFELDEWRRKPYLSRIKPLAQDWAVNGFGTPTAIYLLYVLKLVVYTLGAALVISTTPGLGGLGDIGDWWTEPIVFQKFAVWTLLWEVIGLGCGSMPLTFRFIPPIGGILYWLRPGTVRLPPWPDKVPLTRGTTRTPLDVALYAGVLASAVFLLASDGTGAAGAAGRLDPAAIAVLLGFLGLLGLRDKVSFLGARPEVYGLLLIVFLLPDRELRRRLPDRLLLHLVGRRRLQAQPPLPVRRLGDDQQHAVEPLAEGEGEPLPRPPRRHPAVPRRRVRRPPRHRHGVRPPARPAALRGGTIGWLAVAGMVIFHVHITSTFPLAVPLEWNLFMIFGLFFLFGHYGDVPLSTLDDPLLMVLLAIFGVLMPVVGNLRPDKISFLPSMRYYAGNWATSLWLFRPRRRRRGQARRLHQEGGRDRPAPARPRL